MSHPQALWLFKYLEPLKGCTIVEVRAKVDHMGTWPVLIVQEPNAGAKYELEVSRDEEGNGPGFIFGLPHVTLEAPKPKKSKRAPKEKT